MFSKFCEVYQREIEIIEVKCRINVTLLDTRKTVKLHMKEIIYTTVAQKTSPISNNKQPDKYKTLIEKLIQLGLNDWLKFQKQLRKMHLAEIKPREPTSNIHITPPKISINDYKTPTKINAVRRKLHTSPIGPPTSKIDHSRKAHNSNSEANAISNSEKIKYNYTNQT